MELGLCVDPRLDRTWEEALDLAVRTASPSSSPVGVGMCRSDTSIRSPWRMIAAIGGVSRVDHVSWAAHRGAWLLRESASPR